MTLPIHMKVVREKSSLARTERSYITVKGVALNLLLFILFVFFNDYVFIYVVNCVGYPGSVALFNSLSL